MPFNLGLVEKRRRPIKKFLLQTALEAMALKPPERNSLLPESATVSYLPVIKVSYNKTITDD